MKTATRQHFIVTDTISCGDPCYETPEVTIPAKKGKWVACVDSKECGMWGNRVSRITVHHQDFSPVGNRYTKQTEYVPVDSGQAGVFAEYGMDFYDECCSATLGKKGYGFTSNGFVSSSGYGDGYYKCEIYKQNGKAVGVEITFIAED